MHMQGGAAAGQNAAGLGRTTSAPLYNRPPPSPAHAGQQTLPGMPGAVAPPGMNTLASWAQAGGSTGTGNTATGSGVYPDVRLIGGERHRRLIFRQGHVSPMPDFSRLVLDV